MRGISPPPAGIAISPLNLRERLYDAIDNEISNARAGKPATASITTRTDGKSDTPRIGITKAAEEPLRYVIADNAFVSGKRI